MRRQIGNPTREDQPSAPVRIRLLFMGVAPVHDERRPLEALSEELRVGIDLEGLGHFAIAVGEHPVGRDDGIAFNADRL